MNVLSPQAMVPELPHAYLLAIFETDQELEEEMPQILYRPFEQNGAPSATLGADCSGGSRQGGR
jgi:hypothetical protein